MTGYRSDAPNNSMQRTAPRHRSADIIRRSVSHMESNMPGRISIALIYIILCCISGKNVYSQKDENNEKSLSIEACRVPLTAIGRQGTFTGTALYKVNTGKQGEIVEISPISIPDIFRVTLELDMFECCMRHWRLNPSAEYSVALQAGTTGETLRRWVIVVSEKNGSSIDIVLANRSECKESENK